MKIYKSRYQAYKAKSIYETIVRVSNNQYILVNKVCDMFNSETGEIKTVDARGNDIVYFNYYK